MRKASIARLQLPAGTILPVFLTGILMFQFSCNYFYSKDKYLSDFDTFVTGIENNYTTQSPAQWEQAGQEYEQFNTELYQRIYTDLTPDDQQTIGRLKARFAKVQLKYKLNRMLDGVKDGVEQLKGAVDEMERE